MWVINKWDTGYYRSVKLYDCHCRLTLLEISSSNPKDKQILIQTMTLTTFCQYLLIDYKHCNTLMQVVIGRESDSKWGHGTLGSSKFAFSPMPLVSFSFSTIPKTKEKVRAHPNPNQLFPCPYTHYSYFCAYGEKQCSQCLYSKRMYQLLRSGNRTVWITRREILKLEWKARPFYGQRSPSSGDHPLPMNSIMLANKCFIFTFLWAVFCL